MREKDIAKGIQIDASVDGLIGNRWNNTLDTYTLGVTLSIPIFDGG